ncbi:hypothetical protein IG631_04888 [Alternaria alternata]|nr:hypothetical protein IG631_04888 [Alternaria alternata]
MARSAEPMRDPLEHIMLFRGSSFPIGLFRSGIAYSALHPLLLKLCASLAIHRSLRPYHVIGILSDNHKNSANHRRG